MPGTAGPNLGMVWGWSPGEPQWGSLGFNPNMAKLDCFVCLAVLAQQNAPPGAPNAGDRYIVGTSPTGAWAGQANKIARWIDSAWEFHTQLQGMVVWNDGTNSQWVYDGSWAAIPTPLPGAGTVTLAMMANIATNTLIGRATAGTGVPETITLTAAGRALLDDADASAQRTTLGLGTAATQASTAFQTASAMLTALAGMTYTARASVELTAANTITLRPIGVTNSTDVLDRAAGDGRYQPLDGELTAIAGLTSAADKGVMFTGSGTAGTFDLTAAGRALIDDANASAQRTTLGLPGSVTTRHNFTATTDPTTSDDSSGGYSDGSMWFNKTTGMLYLLIDPSIGAAVWLPYRAALNLPYRSGAWIGFGAVTALAATTLSAGIMYGVPIPIRWPVKIDQVAINIATGVAGNARLGLYANAVNGIGPTSRIIECDAPVDTTSTGLVAATITSPPWVYPPLVWGAMLPDAAAQPSAYPANGAHPGYAAEILGGATGSFVSSSLGSGRAGRATLTTSYAGGLPSTFGSPGYATSGSPPMITLRTV